MCDAFYFTSSITLNYSFRITFFCFFVNIHSVSVVYFLQWCYNEPDIVKGAVSYTHLDVYKRQYLIVVLSVEGRSDDH